MPAESEKNSTQYVDQLILTTLTNRESMHRILQDDPFSVEGLTDHTMAFTAEETKIWFTRLFDISAHPLSKVSIDQRRAATSLLRLNLAGKIDMEGNGLLQIYKSAVNRTTRRIIQEGNENDHTKFDPNERFAFLLTAGEKVAGQFPTTDEAKEEVIAVWSDAAKAIEQAGNPLNIDLEYITEESKIVADGIQTPEKLGWRKKPTGLSPAQEEAHDKYLEVTKKEGSLKLSLWDSVPEFRKLAESYGIDMAQFWNISPVDQIAQATAALKQSNPELMGLFDKQMKKTVGATLSDLDFRRIRVVADQVQAVASEIKETLQVSIKDSDGLGNIDKFKKLLSDPRISSPGFARSIMSQINKFLEESGLPKGSNTDQLITILSDPEQIKIIVQSEEQKKRTKRAQIESIDHSFGLSTKHPRFGIAPRTENDLFLGDLTGDCTAYHLNVGMNAWTVPLWFSNPGFSMFTDFDQKNLNAKLGMLIGLEGTEPVLVIDSIEVGTGKRTDPKTITAVQEDLQYIETWAKKAGFKKVRFNTVTNSNDLDPEIKAMTNDNEYSINLELLGGMTGLEEYQKNVGINNNTATIYIQSEEEEGYEDDHDAVEGEYVDPQELEEQQANKDELKSDVEKLINLVLTNTDTEKAAKIAEARSDWPTFFKLLIDTRLPELHKYIPTDINSLKKYVEIGVKNTIEDDTFSSYIQEVGNHARRQLELDMIDIWAKAHPGEADYDEHNRSKAEKITTNNVHYMESDFEEENDYGNSTTFLFEHFLTNIFSALHMSDKLNYPPEQIIKELYGQPEKNQHNSDNPV